jgi:DNA-binding Lrp family transcriptional regulator
MIPQQAKVFSLWTTPVHERLKRLQAAGVIDPYGAVLDTVFHRTVGKYSYIARLQSLIVLDTIKKDNKITL